jgi:hypothetical protein
MLGVTQPQTGHRARADHQPVCSRGVMGGDIKVRARVGDRQHCFKVQAAAVRGHQPAPRYRARRRCSARPGYHGPRPILDHRRRPDPARPPARDPGAARLHRCSSAPDGPGCLVLAARANRTCSCSISRWPGMDGWDGRRDLALREAIIRPASLMISASRDQLEAHGPRRLIAKPFHMHGYLMKADRHPATAGAPSARCSASSAEYAAEQAPASAMRSRDSGDAPAGANMSRADAASASIGYVASDPAQARTRAATSVPSTRTSSRRCATLVDLRSCDQYIGDVEDTRTAMTIEQRKRDVVARRRRLAGDIELPHRRARTAPE